MEPLPHIDEHTFATNASREAVWSSLVHLLREMGNHAFARLLGCDPARRSDPFDGTVVGQTVPGFRVVEVNPGRSMILEGRHRFSRYRLAFYLDQGRIRARTDAAFPGVRGRLYRAAVIDSGAHKQITRRMLRQIAAGARRTK
jgi:hypothetical protein